MKIPTLATGMLYDVHNHKAQLIASMERRTAFKLIALIALCVVVIVWNLMR